MNSNAMVAVCDILGFSPLVKKSTLTELKVHISTIIDLLSAASIPPGKTKSNHFQIGHAFFSDTVLIYSLLNDKRGYQDLITVVTYLIATPIQHPEYRFRAGISYGEFYHEKDKNVYAGKALVEAHELEKYQEWCGGALTEAAENEVARTNVDRTYLTKYDVPVKNGKKESHLVINWTQASHQEIDQECSWLNRPDSSSLTDEEVAAVEHKIINMERFHLDKCSQCRTHRANLRKKA